MEWKRDYELGSELIDNQHKELFKRVKSLNKLVEGEDAASRKDECIDAILFLKDYAVKHFAAEEEFQEALGYKYIEFHKAVHSSFISSVLEAEQKLISSDFSLPVIKEFCGFLSMWLIYHVAGADKKIVTDDVISVAEFALTVSYEDCVLESMKELLVTVIGGNLKISPANKNDKIINPVVVDAQYDDNKMMRFKLARETALSLVNAITDLNLTEVDELAYAALTQFAATICNNASAHIGHGEDAKARSGLLMSGNEFFISTLYGPVSFSLINK